MQPITMEVLKLSNNDEGVEIRGYKRRISPWPEPISNGFHNLGPERRGPLMGGFFPGPKVG